MPAFSLAVIYPAWFDLKDHVDECRGPYFYLTVERPHPDGSHETSNGVFFCRSQQLPLAALRILLHILLHFVFTPQPSSSTMLELELMRLPGMGESLAHGEWAV